MTGVRDRLSSLGFGRWDVVVIVLWLTTLVWLAPSAVILRNDDFGYIEQIVLTLQHGSWSQSDWLEPLNLPLTAASVALYRLTGSFYLSTVGLNVTIGLAAFLLLRAWLRIALPGAAGAIAALALALFPVALNKAVEFSGVPLGMLCTLAAFLAWRQRRWGWFFPLALFGFLNRQSAICLLILPAVELATTWATSRRVAWNLVLGSAATGATMIIVVLRTPPTWARELAAHAGPPEIPVFARNLALAALILAAGKAISLLLQGESPRATLRNNFRRPLVPLLVMGVGAGLIATDTVRLRLETPGLQPWAAQFVVVATLLAAWGCRWSAPFRLGEGVYVFGFSALVAWRGIWWDYYFLEPLLLILGTPAANTAGVVAVRWRTSLVLLGAGLIYAVNLNGYLREAEARVITYERALRDGSVTLTELSDAPFGYLAWKLFPAARHRADARALSDFLKFVDGGRASYARGGFTVDRTGHRRSLHPSREKWSLSADYHARPFPLNHQEWREFLEHSATP